MKNKKGFTLIELLAVIIILGILTFIAIPAVSGYIEDTKRTSYIVTAKSIAGSVGEVANSEKLEMNDILTTYYIPVRYVNTENELSSPYGDFTEAYVGVITDGEHYSYYWVSRDSTGVGIKNITPVKKLNKNDLVTSIPVGDVTEVIRTTGVGNRYIIKIFNVDDGNWETINLQNTANNIFEDGSPADHIGYPLGKTRETVQVGDTITIGDQEFHLIKKDGNDLILFARYNLYVGSVYLNGSKVRDISTSEAGYGLQSPDAIGYVGNDIESVGVVKFSNSNYWDGKVGEGKQYPGRYCPGAPFTDDCVYVYDSNSTLSVYINNYVSYLESLGVSIKSGRLISMAESLIFENLNISTNHKTAYSTGTATDSSKRWSFIGRYYTGMYGISSYANASTTGVRPIIVI